MPDSGAGPDAGAAALGDVPGGAAVGGAGAALTADGGATGSAAGANLGWTIGAGSLDSDMGEIPSHRPGTSVRTRRRRPGGEGLAACAFVGDPLLQAAHGPLDEVAVDGGQELAPGARPGVVCRARPSSAGRPAGAASTGRDRMKGRRSSVTRCPFRSRVMISSGARQRRPDAIVEATPPACSPPRSARCSWSRPAGATACPARARPSRSPPRPPAGAAEMSPASAGRSGRSASEREPVAGAPLEARVVEVDVEVLGERLVAGRQGQPEVQLRAGARSPRCRRPGPPPAARPLPHPGHVAVAGEADLAQLGEASAHPHRCPPTTTGRSAGAEEAAPARAPSPRRSWPVPWLPPAGGGAEATRCSMP